MKSVEEQGLRSYFNLNSEFQECIEQCLERADSNGIFIFDDDGSIVGLDKPSIIDALSRAADRRVKIQIICLNPDRLLITARFCNFVEKHAGNVSWHVVRAELKDKIQPSLCIAGSFVVKKPVRVAAHGFVSSEADSVRSAMLFYKELLEECEVAPPITPLGL